MAEFTEVKTTTKTVNCPACGAEKVVRDGRNRGYQRYRCQVCGKRIRAEDKAPGRRLPDEQTGAVIRMYYGGMSYKQIAETMADMFDMPEPSKATVYEIVRDYSGLAVKEMKRYPARVGDSWVADEMMVKVGGENYWNWNIVDEKTRYILASYLSKERDARAATALLRKAKASASIEPKTIKTDKWRAYPPAIKKVFPRTKHVQSEGLTAEVNNNLSERLQGTFRQRTKTLRGLENRATGQKYLDGWVLDYNLFREHEALDDKTPGEVAKSDAPFKEWADVVRADLGNRSVANPKGGLPNLPQMSEIREVRMSEQPKEEVERVRTMGTRLPVRRASRQFQSAAAKGRTAGSRNPAWVRRGEARGKVR